MKRGVRKGLPVDKLGRERDRSEKLKASIRAKVENPFHVIKNLLGHSKTTLLWAGEKNGAPVLTVWLRQSAASPTDVCRRFVAEVRPKGLDSGVNALVDRVLSLNAAFFRTFLERARGKRLKENLISVSLIVSSASPLLV